MSTIKSCSYLLKMVSSVFAFLVLLLCITAHPLSAQEDSLLVISSTQEDGRWYRFTDAENSLYHHLSGEAFKLLEKRADVVSSITTADGWRNRQSEIRQTLDDIIGPFPEKTPLNAQVTGIIQKDGFHVEKILYESRPGYFVTSALFVPDGLKEKAPGILFCVGHSAAAFRRPLYQQVVLNLVKKGFVVLAIEPIGQGERLQYYDPETGESRIGGSTLEHSYPGAQCFLAGNSVANYFIWDGIRGIDYLVSRGEVDPGRIGCHGLSGGGTQSSYIAAFDSRVTAVAPAGFITSLRRLFESIGPQDGEQNMYEDIARGLDHADLLAVRAPKPALIMATTRDFFSIQGSRETLGELKRMYAAFGAEDNIAITEDDHGHGYTQKNREALYAFFQKHLDLPGSPAELEIPYLTAEELTVTETGQITTALGSKTAFDINAAETEPLIQKLKQSRRDLNAHLEHVRTSAKELSGYVEPDNDSKVVFTGRHHADGYVIEKYFMRGDGDYPIPFLMLIPDGGGRHPAVLYIHPESKTADMGPGGPMEWFVKKGYVVLAPDLAGTGETGPGEYVGDAYNFKVGTANYNLWFAGLRVGRSIAAIRAGDTVRLARYLTSRPDIDSGSISAVTSGAMCPALLHAAAFDATISNVTLVEPLVSWRSIVMNRYYNPSFILNSVAGALTAYDLPDLAACIVPRRLSLVNMTDQIGNEADQNLIDSDMAVTRAAFKAAGTEKNLRILNTESPFDEWDDIFKGW